MPGGDDPAATLTNVSGEQLQTGREMMQTGAEFCNPRSLERFEMHSAAPTALHSPGGTIQKNCLHAFTDPSKLLEFVRARLANGCALASNY